MYEDTRTAFTDRVLARPGDVRARSPRLRPAVRGWVAFTEEVTVDWLSRGTLDRDDLVELIDEALVALVTVATGTRPDMGEELSQPGRPRPGRRPVLWIHALAHGLAGRPAWLRPIG